MEFVVILIILTILVALAALIRNKIRNEPLTRLIIIKTFLLSFLVISVGIGSIWAFIGHAFMPVQVAQSIGWATGSPFQTEVAFANLAIGILGILCYFFRDNFWVATVIVSSIFLLGAAYVHVINIINYSNHSAGNAGTIFFMDIIGPVILVALLILYKLYERKQMD
jgi:NADH:ubiquinone oxidoreductase subunit K